MEKTIILDAEIENLYQILDIVETELNNRDCDKRIIADLDICIEEIFVNIASYAYGENKGKAEIIIKIDEEACEVTFMDSGIPYNPLDREAPDATLSIDERGIGGWGIFMVKEMMDSVIYEYKEEKNCLRIKKKILKTEL